MRISKLSIGALFLISSNAMFFSQTVQDTIRKESKISDIVIQGTNNKKTESYFYKLNIDHFLREMVSFLFHQNSRYLPSKISDTHRRE